MFVALTWNQLSPLKEDSRVKNEIGDEAIKGIHKTSLFFNNQGFSYSVKQCFSTLVCITQRVPPIFSLNDISCTGIIQWINQKLFLGVAVQHFLHKKL